MMQKIFHCVALALCVQETHCFSHPQQTKRRYVSTSLELSQVKGFSSYDENLADSLIKDNLDLFDGQSQEVGLTYDAVASTTTKMMHVVAQTFAGSYDSLQTVISSQYASLFQRNFEGLTNNSPVFQPIRSFIQSLHDKVQSSSFSLSPPLSQFHMNMGDLLGNVHVMEWQIVGVQFAGIISLLLFMLSFQTNAAELSTPYPDGRYNATSAKLYFDQRRWIVLGRFLQIATASSVFLFKVLGDYLRLVESYRDIPLAS
jgi:hypothetical protein